MLVSSCGLLFEFTYLSLAEPLPDILSLSTEDDCLDSTSATNNKANNSVNICRFLFSYMLLVSVLDCFQLLRYKNLVCVTSLAAA